MLGVRGVRLAVIKPGLYAMQVRALLDAGRTVSVRRKPDRRGHDPSHHLGRRNATRQIVGHSGSRGDECH
ncbi:MAG: putative PEP-binding protein [Microthrixaceae bacterium]